jgi:hypothetical protein
VSGRRSAGRRQARRQTNSHECGRKDRRRR